MKEFRKLFKVRQSYHEKFDAPFLGHSVCDTCLVRWKARAFGRDVLPKQKHGKARLPIGYN